MAASPEQALALLMEHAGTGQLDALCERHQLRLLVAFGSAVRGEVDAHDLDVAAAYAAGASRDILALVEDLTQLCDGADVDVMMLDRAGPVARKNPLVQCVPLYESRRGVYAESQIAAMLERMDTAWLRKLDLELMAKAHAADDRNEHP